MSQTITTIRCDHQQHAVSAILSDLGHEITGSLAAQLDARIIEIDRDGTVASVHGVPYMADIYTHRDLSGRQYVVSAAPQK